METRLDLEYLATILGELPFFISLVDEQDRIVWVNRSAVSREQLIGVSVFHLTEPAFHPLVVQGLAAARQGGSGEWVAKSSIPELHGATFRSTAHHLPRSDSSSLLLLVTSDVTTQRSAEVALEASEARYRALLEAHPDYISTIDPDRRFRSFNRLAPGLTSDLVLGRRVDDFLAPETAAVALPIIARAFADGTPGHYPGVAKLPEGDRHFNTRVLVVPPEQGEPRLMMITTDITDVHEAAQSIRRGEARLEQAQRLEIVGQLAGGVAHDFNNMLLVINAQADRAARRAEDPTVVAECLAAICTAVGRASELTGQLLAVARRQSIAKRPVDLGGLLDETIRLLGRTLPETITISRRGDATAWVNGDPGQLSQVIVNLALNARDAMPTGGDLIFDIAAHRDSGTVRLTVRDTGQGIAPEVLGRVFEPFFTTKEAGLGSGLGLAVAHGIIQQHDGRIEVESALDRGTEFQVDLPAGSVGARTKSAVEPRASADGAVLLLAEDEEPVRRVVGAMLEDAGYRVLYAHSGTAAIALVREHRDIALAILDVIMPDGTGRDVYNVIVAERPHVSVLFTTGYGAGVLPEDIGSKPGAGLMMKPYAMNDLLAKVRSLLASPEPSDG